MKLSFIVPCFNEVDNVSKLHDELLPVIEDIGKGSGQPSLKNVNLVELIFVDDGSRDGTLERLKATFKPRKDSDVIFKYARHDINRGLGAAIRTGFQTAEGDILITVDSDGTYDFKGIPELLSILSSGADIVTASPYHPKGGVAGVPGYRLFLSRGSSFLYRILVDRNVYTYTCLFRAYRSDVIKNISFRSDGFLAGSEILVKAILQGFRVAEFPAVLHKRTYGVSKARIAQTIFSHLGFQTWVLMYRVQSLMGFHHPREERRRL